jgi:hypothetical protein
MSTDANKADDIFNLVSQLCNLPLQFISTIIVLCYYFGTSLFAALLFTFFTFKVNQYFTYKVKILKREKERLGDIKKNLLGEILNNIKMLKLFGWEDYFS